jgi:EsV-1-7 cysteine-rich motif
MKITSKKGSPRTVVVVKKGVHKKRCEGCNKRPVFGMLGAGARRCKEHILDGMIDVKHPKCGLNGCKIQPTFGVVGAKRATRCRDHASDGMEDIKHNRCGVNGCKVRPSFGRREDVKATRCVAHKDLDMEDIVHDICGVDGCRTRPCYGAIGTKTATHCVDHADDKMEDVTSARCGVNGCKTQPSYGLPNSSSVTRCAKHADAGMQDLRKPQCGVDGCQKRPCFGFYGDETATRCVSHADEGMEDIKNRQCDAPQCATQPNFGFIDQIRASRCSQHIDAGMVDLTHRKCGIDGCTTQPRYALEGSSPTRCYQHKSDGMIDVVHRYCPHGRRRHLCEGIRCGMTLAGRSMEEIRAAAVVFVVHTESDDLDHFTRSMDCKFQFQQTKINVDMILELRGEKLFFEYDGNYYHHNKHDNDWDKTCILSKHGRVLRIMDRLEPIEDIENCQCIIIDRSRAAKLTEETIAQQIYTTLCATLEDKQWAKKWIKIKSLADRAINYFKDKRQRTLQQNGMIT